MRKRVCVCLDHLSIHMLILRTKPRSGEWNRERMADIESQNKNGFIILYFIFAFIRSSSSLLTRRFNVWQPSWTQQRTKKELVEVPLFRFHSFNHFRWFLGTNFSRNIMVHIFFNSLFSKNHSQIDARFNKRDGTKKQQPNTQHTYPTENVQLQCESVCCCCESINLLDVWSRQRTKKRLSA